MNLSNIDLTKSTKKPDDNDINTGLLDIIYQQKNTILNKDNIIADKESVIADKESVIAEQQKRIAMLEEYLRLERSRLYGRSTEKTAQQSDLFNEVEAAFDEQEQQEKEEPSSKPKQSAKGRKPLSDKLPRIQVYLNLTDAEKKGAIDTFYSKVKEELDIIPAKVRVIEYLQEKAVFGTGEQREIKVAGLPKHPVPKAVGSISMLAYIITSKYCDALPLYRLESILKRYGGSVTRATMAAWVMRSAELCIPLINLLRERQNEGRLIQADETIIQVIKELSKSINSDKYMWVSKGGPPDQRSVLFEYDPSRSKTVPLRLFEGFKGYLQTDGYASYREVCEREKCTSVGCWDHARRYFVNAKKGEVKGTKKKSATPSKADVALAQIRKLYKIESDIEALNSQEKYYHRQQRSLPLLKQFKKWLERNITRVEAQSLVHKAINYALNQWDSLIVYCEDGELPISNAGAENAVRPFCIGRKNWMFADTPRGARASAVFYSLIETAKLHSLEPYDYLCRLLTDLPYAETVEQLEALLPWNIKVSQAV